MIAMFLKQFRVTRQKPADEAQSYIDSAFSLVKWQRLNLQSFIEHKRGNFEAAKNCLMQAIREPDRNPVVYKNQQVIYLFMGFRKPYMQKKPTKNYQRFKSNSGLPELFIRRSKTEGVLTVRNGTHFVHNRPSPRVSKASALRSVERKKNL